MITVIEKNKISREVSGKQVGISFLKGVKENVPKEKSALEQGPEAGDGKATRRSEEAHPAGAES